jgi:hypothetical protein
MRAINDQTSVMIWTKRLLVLMVLLPVLGCATTTTQPGVSSETPTTKSGGPGAPTATAEPKSAPTAPPGTTAQSPDAAKGATKSQQGETALRGTSESPASIGETEGQRTIRQQSEKQHEITSTSPGTRTPDNVAPAPCEGFPGFDRGCPGGGK